MPKISFEPGHGCFEVNENTKVLAAAVKNKVDIRYGCGACNCGTCAVKVSPRFKFSAMDILERDLLKKMTLPIDGSIRLSCQAKVLDSDVEVDLSFQDKYSPDRGIIEE